jgi:hypothetical protein
MGFNFIIFFFCFSIKKKIPSDSMKKIPENIETVNFIAAHSKALSASKQNHPKLDILLRFGPAKSISSALKSTRTKKKQKEKERRVAVF